MLKRAWLTAAIFRGCVILLATMGSGTCLAAEDHIWPSTPTNDEPQSLLGKLFEVKGDTLNIHDLMFHEDEWAQPGSLVKVDDNTSITIDFEKASIKDLQPGLVIRCWAWKQPSGPPKVFVNEELPSKGGLILKLEGNSLICPVNLYWIDHQAVKVDFDNNTKVFYWPDEVKPPGVQLEPATLADLKAGVVVEAVPDTGVAKKIYIRRQDNTVSPDMAEAKSAATLSARQFSSKLALDVVIVPSSGRFSLLQKPIGETPLDQPVSIPAGRMWYVIPDGKVDQAALVAEINVQNIPGLALTDIKAGSDLSFLEKLPNLRYLQLSGPGVTDAQLAHISSLSKLEDLDLQSDSNVTDAGLKNLANLDSLLHLDLSGTQITGATFRDFGPLSSLVQLNLDGCPIDDAGLQQVEGSFPLRQLYLANTKVTDAGMQWLLGLTQIEQLDLSGTQVTDGGLGYFEGMRNMQNLSLANTKVSSTGMEYLQEMTSMQMLDISNTQVDDSGLQYVKLMTKLEQLNLSNSKVTPAGVQAIKQALPNCGLDE